MEKFASFKFRGECKENSEKQPLLLAKECDTSNANSMYEKATIYCIIPQRYVVAIMGFFAILNAFTMRISLSIAITEMVSHPNQTANFYDHDTCPYPDGASSEPVISDQNDLYDWDEKTQGLILSSFYIGYIVTHLPGGILAEKFGGKYSLGLGILSTAVFTLITPAVVRLGDWRWLCALRVAVGLGEGTTYPALTAILAKWVPVSERSKLGTLTFTGSLFGTIIANLVGGVLIQETQNWASVFYLFGGMGVLWFIIWTLICYSDPQSHPFISAKEKRFLEREIPNRSDTEMEIPWKGMLTSLPVWALLAATIGSDWGFFVMITDLPKYMKDVLKFSVAANGLWSSLPYFVMWFSSLFFGWACDWLINKKYIGITAARKSFAAFAVIVPSSFMVAASYSGCNRALTVILFTIAMAGMGPYYCGLKVNPLDLASNYAGTLTAIVNGIGAITGAITPYLIGALTTDHTLSQWRIVFWITFAVYNGSNIIYALWASGEEQWWNTPGAKEPASLKQNGTQTISNTGARMP